MLILLPAIELVYATDKKAVSQHEYKQEAFNNITMLRKVADFKIKFYPRKWARYEEAQPGTLKLLPPEYRLDYLRNDYDSMADMLFGEYPAFDELMAFIESLENEINKLN